jgi:hypothetical protein
MKRNQASKHPPYHHLFQPRDKARAWKKPRVHHVENNVLETPNVPIKVRVMRIAESTAQILFISVHSLDWQT